MKNCYCSSYGCSGMSIPARTWRAHRKKDQDSRLPVATSVIGEFDTFINFDMYQSHWIAKKKLTESSNKTILEALFEIIRDFVITPNLSKSFITRQLQTFKNLFPNLADTLPDTFDKLVSFLEPFLLPLHKINVCPNDCILFRKEYELEKKCPVCGTDRYGPDGKTARKNFTYFPLTPRIRRMIATQKIFELLNAHKTKPRRTYMQDDLHDSKSWREEWFGDQGELSDVDSGIVLTLCLDGVNPFTQQQVDYSMWPIEISIDNLPPDIRKTCVGILILGIVPGLGSKEPKTLEPYIEILVDELQELQNCKMYNFHGKMITVSVHLKRFTLDFPAMGKVLHLPGSARSFRACPYCSIVGESCKCNKTLFLQNRRFLPNNHPMRDAYQGHVGNCSEKRKKPAPPVNVTKNRQLREEYDSIKTKSGKSAFTKEHGLKGRYELMRLDYHRFQEQIVPDIMHTVKDAACNLAKILNGYISPELINVVESEKRIENYKPFKGLSQPEIHEVDRKIGTLIFPSTSTGCKQSFLTNPGKVHPSHAWHEYSGKNVMLFCLRGIDNVRIRRSTIFWLSVINRIVRNKIDMRDNQKLQMDLAIAASLMERDFPLVFNVITTHLLQHEIEARVQYGPVHSRSMWCFERLNSLISRRVKSKKHPEASVMAIYRLLDWVNDVILGERLPNVQEKSLVQYEKTLLGIKNDNDNKRRRNFVLDQYQKECIIAESSVSCIDVNAQEIGWYKKCIEYETIFYQSGNTKNGDYRKSSRFVFVERFGLYGEINTIFEHLKDIWFDITLYKYTNIDEETLLPYIDITKEKHRCVLKPDCISEPFIVSVDLPLIWFISIKHDSKFSLLDNHMNNYQL